MFPNTENPSVDLIEETALSLSLRLKEYFFLIIVFIMGFSGMSLCIEKLYPSTKDDIQNIIIHETDYAQVDLEINS